MFKSPSIVLSSFEVENTTVKNQSEVFKEDPILSTFCSPVLKVLQGFYDSLPSPDSRASLPVAFINSCPYILHFPNKPFSYFLHSSTFCTPKKNCLNLSLYQKYLNELENSVAPYGYEYEDCFYKEGKETVVVPLGKSRHSFIQDFDKCIINTFQQLDVKLNRKNNKLIVISTFLDSTKIVYFKETSKIAFFKKDKHNNYNIVYNSFQNVPSNMIEHISKHVQIKNTLAAQTLLELNSRQPLYVRDIRSLIHNSFYLQSQCLFLLPSNYSYYSTKPQRKLEYAKAVRNQNKYYHSIFKTSEIPERYWKVASNYFSKYKDLKDFIELYTDSNNKNMFLLFFDLQKQHYFHPSVTLSLFDMFPSFVYLEEFIKNIDCGVSNIALNYIYNFKTFKCKTIKEFQYELYLYTFQNFSKVARIKNFDIYKNPSKQRKVQSLDKTLQLHVPINVVLENYTDYKNIYNQYFI